MRPLHSISEARDRLQSRLLVTTVCALLVPACVADLWAAWANGANDFHVVALIVSLTFAALVWVLRAATPAGALCGAMVCLLLTVGTATTGRTPLASALTPLMLLFALTWAATRLGRRRNELLTSKREKRHGRSAAQVLANLATGPLVIVSVYGGWWDAGRHSGLFQHVLVRAAPAMILAALVEATADTVSSEVGQALGGVPVLLTTLRRVPAGTDGAISLLGTAAGCAGGALVALAGASTMRLSVREGLVALAAGVAGLLFDSLLGATVERRGWVGNDLVNFSSTVFAAAVAFGAFAISG